MAKTTQTRTETDTFGPIEVPADRYWGAQAQRSLGNFKIGWEKQPLPIVRALGIVKRFAVAAFTSAVPVVLRDADDACLRRLAQPLLHALNHEVTQLRVGDAQLCAVR